MLYFLKIFADNKQIHAPQEKNVKYSESYKIKELKSAFLTILELIPFYHKLQGHK